MGPKTKNETMRAMISYGLVFTMVISAPATAAPGNTGTTEQTSSNGNETFEDGSGTTFRFREWFKKKREKWQEEAAKAREQANRPSFEDNLKLVLPEKVKTLVDRSLVLAVQQVVEEKYQAAVRDMARDVYKKHGSYVTSPEKVATFSQNSLENLTNELFRSSYQDILNRAHSIATGNLAQWSKEASQNSPKYFTNEYKLYEISIGGVEAAFKRIGDAKQGKASIGPMLNLIRTSLESNLHQQASLSFDTVYKGANAKGKQLMAVEGSKKNTTSKETSQRIPESRATVIIDMTADGKPKVAENFTKVTVEIPAVNMAEVFMNNPETIKYKLRKPLNGVTHFATQSVLFNIPLFFVTVALLGLDSAKNPLALDQFAQSLQDPVVHMGFALFILTNHPVATAFSKIIQNPKLRFMAGYIGMASGMLAQSVFTDLWNDKDLRGCARSMYNPSPENADSCNAFWTSWILTNRIAKYTPAIMGLLATAISAGLLRGIGFPAIAAAGRSLSAAEAELARLMKESVAEDPFIQNSKQAIVKGAGKVKSTAQAGAVAVTSAANTGVEKVRAVGKVIRDQKNIQRAIELAKAKVANAKENLRLIEAATASFKQVLGEGWAATKGRLGVRIAGIWAIPKSSFTSAVQLETYLLNLKKLKGFLNVSLVTIAGNLVFLAMDPFVSEPLHQWMGQKQLADVNFKQWLEDRTLLDNFAEMASAFFAHKIQLPHEKDYQTLPDIVAAYNKSLDYFMKQDDKKKAFTGFDLMKCYVAEPSDSNVTAENVDSQPESKVTLLPEFLQEPLSSLKQGFRSAESTYRKSIKSIYESATKAGLTYQNSDAVSAVVNAYPEAASNLLNHYKASKSFVNRYLMNQGLYALDPECVVRSNFKTWLDKYSEAEKNWRTLALSQVINSSIAWSQTIANFVTSYDSTHDFYTYMAKIIHEYRESLVDNPNTIMPEMEVDRPAILAGVQEISKVPFRGDWTEEDKTRYEGLFDDKVGDFETPEYGDFLIASMACGPDPREAVSFSQKVKSLSWLPWEAVSHLAPSIFSTRQTVVPNSPIIETYPGTSFRYISPRITTGEPSEVCDNDRWESLAPRGHVSYAKKPIPKIYTQPLTVKGERYQNLIEYIFKNAKEEIVRSDDVIDDFFAWNREASTAPIYDEKIGVWPVVKKNYENLMKHHFWPAFNDTTAYNDFPTGGLHAAFKEDVDVRANGLIYSSVNELYTYIRTLRKLRVRLAEVSDKSSTPTAVDYLIQEDFDKMARRVVYSVQEKATARTDVFEFSDARDKLDQLSHLYFTTLPETEQGVAVAQTAAMVFEKMNSVIGEIEGYKKYSQLTFQRGDELPAGTNSIAPGNAYDPRFKGK